MESSLFTSSPINFAPDFTRRLGIIPEEVWLAVEIVTYSQIGDVWTAFFCTSSLNYSTAFPREAPLSPEGLADLCDSLARSLFWLGFKTVLEEWEEWGKMRCTAFLLPCPAELGRGAAQGGRVAGVKTQKGKTAVLCRGMYWVITVGTALVNSFIVVWCNYCWCHQLGCIIYALPFFSHLQFCCL